MLICKSYNDARGQALRHFEDTYVHSENKLDDGFYSENGARLALALSCDLDEDDPCAEPILATFIEKGELEQPYSGFARTRVTRPVSYVWREPPGVILTGMVTIATATCRNHVRRGAEALLDCLQLELERIAVTELRNFPRFFTKRLPAADDIVEIVLNDWDD
jgi:hypothetical protein